MLKIKCPSLAGSKKYGVYNEDASYEERPVRVLDTRDQVLQGKTIPLVKVLWKHHGVEEATWERELEIHEKFPNLYFDVWAYVEILVLFMNCKNIVYVLNYENIVYVEYVLETQDNMNIAYVMDALGTCICLENMEYYRCCIIFGNIAYVI